MANRRFAGPNQWPDNLPGFRETVVEYTNAVDAMTKRLRPALALSLDLDVEFSNLYVFFFHITSSYISNRVKRESAKTGPEPHAILAEMRAG